MQGNLKDISHTLVILHCLWYTQMQHYTTIHVCKTRDEGVCHAQKLSQ